MTATIRDYQPSDERATYYICMKTGDHGKDGEPFFQGDPDALGRIYTAPYLRFAPEFALVLEDEQGVCGYSMGVLDSRKFYGLYERQWRPDLCKQFAAPTGDSSAWTRIQAVYNDYHHPDYFCPEPYDDFPSHLHIDLLPRAQGQGHGRRMIEQLTARLKENGSPGVHLGVSALNKPAIGFYVALGFTELTQKDDVVYMGMRLVP